MKILTSLVLCICAASSFSQKADLFDLQVSNVLLLQLKNVQKELKVTEAQRKQMNVYADQHSSAMKALVASERKRAEKEGKNYRANQEAAKSLFVKMRTGVLSQLSAPQAKRLRELTLQDIGMTALLDGHVAKRIGLSAGQSEKLRSIYEAGANKAGQLEQKAMEPLRAQYKDKKPTSEAERNKLQSELEGKINAALKRIEPQMESIKADTKNRFKSVLDAKQLQTWQSLQGVMFRG